MICCLNSACHNPSCPRGTKFCLKCGTQLVELRRYRPIRQLGSGGFGKTYLAEDIERFNEQCVIKQFAPQSQGTSAFEIATRLFEEEARRLKQLGQHSQIPTLLAYFEQDKRLYLVQEYIEGQTLLDELELQGAFGEQKIREFLLDLLQVLKYVHQEKVLHRDIKPENIIRRKIDSKFVLIDFGASKQLSGTILTKQGTTIGSFGYAPPEQMDGGEAYPASDLYSLGATCFHLLSGINPWELWKRKGYSWINNWQQNLKQSVSLDLGCVLDKLLKEDYQKRYQSAEAVLQDLNRKLPAPPPPVTPPHKPSPQKVVYTNPLLLELIGHTSAVAAIAISPDGQTIVSASADNTIKIWHLRTGKLNLTGHSSWLRAVTISPDGQTLVSGSYDKTIKIRHLRTGELKTTLAGHSDAVYSVAISPDGQTLVSGSSDNTIKIWNLKTDNNIIRIWNWELKTGELKTVELKTTLTGHSESVYSVAISPDGQTLVSGSKDKTIKVWNLQTGVLKTTLTGHSDSVNSVAISPDGETIVSGSGDNTIKIWRMPK